ncbi:Ecm40p [Sugiyamaella lignohabitans]|uniref:Ecm40p n=1 Tax=Sugiyamaella lignohabitans TaxID=796027 RepID=A0A161HIR0_9ASCO|nr:Ecm40p [Sugiyamaella lignohabitans]ANB11098.1 Ecm40p [Sugiyamaella lignohabitans]
MLGWIIPAPLARPAMRYVLDPMENSLDVSLGNVSVVQMPRAQVTHALWSVPRFDSMSDGMPFRILSIGNLWPITPVDMTNEAGPDVTPTTLSVVETMASASFKPPSPVTALAQPLLTIIDRIPVPLVLDRTFLET